MPLKRLFILTACLLALGACRRVNVTPKEREDVVFTVSASAYAAKATESALENGDVIGIFAMEPVNRYNVRGTVSGTGVNMTNPIQWEVDQSVSTRFLAYLPYQTSLSGTEYAFSVKSNQTTAQAYAASDLRLATVDARPFSTVNLAFRHALSKLVVNVTCQSSADRVTSVETGEIVTGAQVNLSATSVTATTVKGTVKLGASGSGYAAVVVPQTGLFPLTVTLANGRTVPCKLETPAQFEPGYAYVATVEIPADYGAVTFRFTVTDWAAGENLPYN